MPARGVLSVAAWLGSKTIVRERERQPRHAGEMLARLTTARRNWAVGQVKWQPAVCDSQTAGSGGGTVPRVFATADAEVPVRHVGLWFRLDPTKVQAGLFARSAGARRFCFNQAVAAIHPNHQAWAAHCDTSGDQKFR